ncbi:hypothetical protein MVEN_02121700 [Mycena venus]|uniref:Uncharacterized protein n=1 Tax=Mycena venus TaxID=2733690 RepID=A0A8H6X9U8_9AGAR|nr:hypothetical protein MVEN_02121700 [Mycena venus]
MSQSAAELKRVIINFIQSQQFDPDQLLPAISTPDWSQKIFANTASQALAREDFFVTGKEVLDFAFFYIVSDSLHGRPQGFLHTIKQVVCSPEALLEIIRKIDFRLAHALDHLEYGFRYFVGYLFERVKKDTGRIVEWLKSLLGPIIDVVTAAYDEPPQNNGRKAKTQKPNEREERRKAAAVQFMKNIKVVQEDDDDSVTSSSNSSLDNSETTSSSESSGRPAVMTSHRVIYLKGPKEEPEDPFAEEPAQTWDSEPIFPSWMLGRFDGNTMDPRLVSSGNLLPAPQIQSTPPSSVPALTVPIVTCFLGTTTSLKMTGTEYKEVFEALILENDELYATEQVPSPVPAPTPMQTPTDTTEAAPTTAIKAEAAPAAAAGDSSGHSATLAPAGDAVATTPTKRVKRVEPRSPLAPLNF